MEFNFIKCEDGTVGLSTNNISNTNITLSNIMKNLDSGSAEDDFMILDETADMDNETAALERKNSFHSTTDAEDILRNGILVETSKGVVCMSLKDVLSSNLNLSVEDFKNVATQLLSQEDGPIPSTDSTLNQTELKLKTEPVETSYTSEVLPCSTEMKQPLSSDIEMTLLTPTPTKVILMPRAPEISRPTSSSSINKLDLPNKQTVLDNLQLQANEVVLKNRFDPRTQILELQSSSVLTSETVDTSEENEKEKGGIVPNVTAKRRGGWPKGRKRKPELLNLPPKAPKTSYNIFLNERRKLYKDQLAFHEITRVVGNQWSNLSTEEKRPYVEKAEEDKKRYREELRIYRQSDAYKLYLARKRKKRALDNLMSESDMDGTDDIDDEDNDMLYCDTCDQWFYNLHNKREHLLSRQHKMTVAGDMTRKLANSDSEHKGHTSSISFSTSLDESSMDGTPIETDCSIYSKSSSSDTESVSDNMVRLIESVTKREKEIKVLNARLQEAVSKQNCYLTELNLLKEKSNTLKNNLLEMKQEEIILEQNLFRLWNVPSLFVMNTVEYVNIV